MLSALDGEDTFLCWPAGGGKTHLMRILAAMFPRCLSLVICTGTCVHAALAKYFGGLPRALWSGCCTACILQGSARLSGRVDGLGAQLAAVGASAQQGA